MTVVPAFVRAQGEIRASFAALAGRTHVERVFETGGLRLRYPNVARGCEAVIVNTGGGVAGGDQALYPGQRAQVLPERLGVAFDLQLAVQRVRHGPDVLTVSQLGMP